MPLVDPAAIAVWRPPKGMTATIDLFELPAKYRLPAPTCRRASRQPINQLGLKSSLENLAAFVE